VDVVVVEVAVVHPPIGPKIDFMNQEPILRL
jgi:hypothetical protein